MSCRLAIVCLVVLIHCHDDIHDASDYDMDAHFDDAGDDSNNNQSCYYECESQNTRLMTTTMKTTSTITMTTSMKMSTFSLMHISPSQLPVSHRLVGLVVKASASEAEDPGFGSRLRRGEFFRGES